MADMKEPINGQYKWSPDTGVVSLVGSKATDHPNLEKQVSLLQWGRV
jgi:hypothetical protein